VGPIGCPETSVTTNQRHVTSHKREYLIYTVAVAGNFVFVLKVVQTYTECRKSLDSRCLDTVCSVKWLVRHTVYIHIFKLDVHESVHRDIITNRTNEMQLYRLIYHS